MHLPDGIHHVELEHGTTSGKRVIRVDGQEVSNNNDFYSSFEPWRICATLKVLRKKWMFSLVGSERFQISNKLATIIFESAGLAFYYTLCIDGQSLKQFIETQKKHTRTWLPTVAGENHRVVLGM